MTSSFCYAILCGGKSLRMGQDKSLLEAEGTPIIQRIVNNLGAIPDKYEKLFICSGDKRYAQLDNKNLFYLDDYLTDYQGPLSALAAVLYCLKNDQSAKQQWVFTFPIDTLLLPSQTFGLIKQSIEQNPTCDMVYLRGERDHPLHGAYRIDIAKKLFDYLNDGERAVMRFIKQLDCQIIDIPKSWSDYINFNTVESFNKALKAQKHAS